MAVTADRLELPIAVADTARELAALIGSTEASIWSRVTRPRGGRQCGYRVYKVSLEGGDEDESSEIGNSQANPDPPCTSPQERYGA